MKKDDARISLDIYKRFADQTEATTKYLDKARRLQGEMGITIPALKHVGAPCYLKRKLLNGYV